MYGFVEFQEKAWSLKEISHIGHLHSKQVVNKQKRRRGEGDNWWCLLRSAGQTQGAHLPHKEEEGEED